MLRLRRKPAYRVLDCRIEEATEMRFWQRMAEAPRPWKIAFYAGAFLVTSGLLIIIAWVAVGRAELVIIAEDTGFIVGIFIVPVLLAFLLVWSLRRALGRAIEKKPPHGGRG
jgi:hypothetical protein